MKLIARHAGLLACAAFALTAAGAAVAGEPADPKEAKVERKVIVQRGGPGGHGGGHGAMMAMRHDPEARAQHLRDILQLRPDQEPALKAFLEATGPQKRMDRMPMEHGKPGEAHKMLTTPERLDLQARRMAARQAAFQKRADATRAFYAALSPSQRKAFDVLHAGHGARGHVKVRRMGEAGEPGGRRIIMRGGPGAMAMLDGEEDVDILLDGEAADLGDEE